MLRWMAPFLSFTAEEAWAVLGAAGKTPGATRESIFMDSYIDLPGADSVLLAKWSRIREIRDGVNKDIEALRAAGKVGSSLQANVVLSVAPDDHALLASLGADLKFVFITSKLTLREGEALAIESSSSEDTKCERCWHYSADVGADSAHPGLCGRCISNLHGVGEDRKFA
jgi:isoleucyl-tRNA synthetase